MKYRFVLMSLEICAVLASGMHVQTDEVKPKTIVTFGTSLTARGGWQTGLQEKLSACLGTPVSVNTVALSGSTFEWGLTKMDDVVAFSADIVIIEFYANDASLHRFVSVSQSSQNITTILRDLRKSLPKARLIVQIMNPFSGMRGFIRPYLDSYIDAHLQAAKSQGAEIIDHRPAWSRLSAADLEKAIPDGAHPMPAAATAVIVPGLARWIAARDC